MVFESEYKLEDVPATRVTSDKIDGIFRSSTIGEFYFDTSSMVDCVGEVGFGAKISHVSVSYDRSNAATHPLQISPHHRLRCYPSITCIY